MRRDIPLTALRPPHPDIGQNRADALSDTTWRALVDAIENPALLVEDDGWVRAANRAAAMLLAPGGPLRMRSGRLEPANPGLVPGWTSLLSDVLRDGRADARLTDADGPLAVRVLHIGSGRLLVLLPTSGGGPRPAPDPVERIAREAGLSGSERAVLRKLLEGHSVRDIAAARATSESTVRSQIRSLLGKTGTTSIRRLLLRVLEPGDDPSRHANGALRVQ